MGLHRGRGDRYVHAALEKSDHLLELSALLSLIVELRKTRKARQRLKPQIVAKLKADSHLKMVI